MDTTSNAEVKYCIERLTEIFQEAFGSQCESEEWNRAKAKKMTQNLLNRVADVCQSKGVRQSSDFTLAKVGSGQSPLRLIH